MIEMLVFIVVIVAVFGFGLSAMQKENRYLRQILWEHDVRLDDLEGPGSLGRLRTDLREKARIEMEARKAARPRIVQWMIENLA